MPAPRSDSSDTADLIRTSGLSLVSRQILKRYAQFVSKFPALRKLGGSGDVRFPLKFASGEARDFHHRQSNADIGVLWDTFLNEDYKLDRMSRFNELVPIYRSILSAGRRPLIVDAGSNIGASILYFAQMFPAAHVVGFEPDADNFRLLVHNTRGLDVDLRNAAVGARAGRTTLVDPGMGQWGYRTQPDPQGTCAQISMTEVVDGKIAEGFSPFFAKIDIEGGESDLFGESTEWADAFALLIIELHDTMLPRQKTSHPFLQTVLRGDRDIGIAGPNFFSFKNVLR